MADNLLDKASILLTPTAYDNGSMLSIKPENGDGDFTFSRNSAATRVNAQGLVENVQIISSELVSNGNFSQIGTEEVSNGNFSQEGSELVTNGSFDTDSDWTKQSSWSIGGGAANYDFLSDSKYIRQTLLNGGFVAGKTYKINFEITSGTAYMNVNSNGGGLISLNSYSVGSYSIYVTPSISASDLLFYGRNTSGTAFSIDNVSVKEVGQNWTLGTGWSIGEDKAISDGLSNFENIYQTISPNLVIGNSYLISFDLIVTSGALRIRTDSGTYYSNVFNTSGNQSVTLTLESGSDFWFNSYSGFEGSITNISVKEVAQNWTSPDYNSALSIVGGQLKIESTVSLGRVVQAITTVVGKTYLASANITNIDSSTGIQLKLSNGSNLDGAFFDSSFNTTTNIVTIKHNFVATATTTYIGTSQGSSAGQSGLLGNVSIKEITDSTNIPRIDYTDGCGSWLLEPQSTNLVTYSENFSDSSWANINSSETSGFLAPNGQNDAFRFLTTSGGSSYLFASNISVSNLTEYTISCYAKSNDNGLDDFKFYTSAGFSPVITTSNKWQRFEFTVTTNSTNIDVGFNGQGTNTDILIWGFQVEQQSQATSYIPSSGAASTRLQDIANNSGNSTLINSTEGVLYAEMAALADDGSARIISISDGNPFSNNISIYYFQSSGFIFFQKYVNGVRTTNLSTTSITKTDFNKIAIRYNSTEVNVFVNGSNILNNADTNIIAPNTLQEIQFDRGDGTSNFYGKAKALAVYKEALTDANLRSLTYPATVATTFNLDFDTIANDFTFTRGSEATFVNAQGLIESTASNDAPRIDYSTGAKAFLLEPQSTNLITYSSDFSNAYWSKTSGGTASSPVVTSNYAISPDGTLNADRLIFDIGAGGSSADISQLQSPNFVMAGDYSNSVYLKSNTGDDYVFTYTTPSGGSTSITITSEWKRFENTATSNTTTRAFKLRLRGSESTSSYADISIYGAQLEQQSYATSYIPTSGASATRNQELCADATPVINSEEGVLYAEISALANDGTNRYLTLTNGTSNERVALLFSANTNELRAIIFSSTQSINISFTTSSVDVLDYNKLAIRYKSGGYAFYVNGNLIGTNTSSSIFTSNTLNELSFDVGSGSLPFFGNTKGLKYYPKALADIQLEDLTTI